MVRQLSVMRTSVICLQSVVFACKSTSIIGYIDPPVDNGFNAHIVPALDSEHFCKEIRQVYLSALIPVVLAEYRYPNDAKALHVWINASETTNFYLLKDLIDRADSLHLSLVYLMESCRSWLKSIASVRELLNLTNWLGEGMAVGWFLLCFLIFQLDMLFVTNNHEYIEVYV